jgi:tetratricopeptide (TPR) repeat protein
MLVIALFSVAIAFTLPTLGVITRSTEPVAIAADVAAQQKPTMPEAEFENLKDEVEKEINGINQEGLKTEARFTGTHSRIDRALALWPKDAALHRLKAQVYGLEKDAKSAEAELQRAVELDPEYLPSYSSLASLYISSNQAELAISVLRQLLGRKPSEKAFTLMGNVELNRQNYEAAAKSYRKALELDPSSDIAANNLAWLYSEAGWKVNADEAIRLASKVVERRPDEPMFADTLGWAFYMKGRYSKAVKYLSRAVALARERGRDSEFFRFHFGMALAASGDHDGARRELLKALELGGDGFKQAEEARKVLASLKAQTLRP